MTIGRPLPEGWDDSYVPKFKTGELVAPKAGGWVGEVLPSSQYSELAGGMMYSLLVNGIEFTHRESSLRELTFLEFACHKDTGGHGFMVGKTRGWMALLIHVFTLILIGASFTIQGPWLLAPLLIGSGVLAIFWVSTRMNFTKRLV